MEPWLAPYASVLSAFGVTASLSLVQLIAADVAGIRAGHVPGTPVDGGHGDLLFRTTRAHANMNETIAVFVLASLFGILSGADPTWLGRFAWTYVAARCAHTLCYWGDLRLPRSAAFVVSFVALVGMLWVGFTAG